MTVASSGTAFRFVPEGTLLYVQRGTEEPVRLPFFAPFPCLGISDCGTHVVMLRESAPHQKLYILLRQAEGWIVERILDAPQDVTAIEWKEKAFVISAKGSSRHALIRIKTGWKLR